MYTPLLSPHTCYMPSPSHSWFDQLNDIWWVVHRRYASSCCLLHYPCHLVPPSPVYLSHHSVPRHLQPVFCFQCQRPQPFYLRRQMLCLKGASGRGSIPSRATGIFLTRLQIRLFFAICVRQCGIKIMIDTRFVYLPWIAIRCTKNRFTVRRWSLNNG